MKGIHILVFVLLLSFSFNFSLNKESLQESLFSMASQIANNTYSVNYSMTTSEGYNMDCLKIIYKQDKQKLGIFHSSKGQSDSYNRLYATIQPNEN